MESAYYLQSPAITVENLWTIFVLSLACAESNDQHSFVTFRDEIKFNVFQVVMGRGLAWSRERGPFFMTPERKCPLIQLLISVI